MLSLRMSVHEERRALVEQMLGPYMQGKRDSGMVSQYNRIAPGSDGKIHTEPNPIGTSTGRFSTSESNLDEASTNLQNLTKKVGRMDKLYQLRDCIVTEPNMVLWSADFVGAEGLIAAAYQNDWSMFDMLMDGRDVHKWHASIFFNKLEDQVTAFERDIGKNIGFGGQYKASAWKLMQTVNTFAEKLGVRYTQREVEDKLAMMTSIHPWEKWWYDVETELATNDNATRNCFGFRRQFFFPDAEKRLKEALANYPQSTIASLISEVMIDMEKELDRPGEFELRLQVHDELLGLVRVDMIDKYAPLVVGMMERRFELNEREIYVPASFSVGTDWGHMSSWEGAQ